MMATTWEKARRVSRDLWEKVDQAKARASRNAADKAAASQVGKAARKERKAEAKPAAVEAGPSQAKSKLARKTASFKAGARALGHALLRCVSGGR
jgi:hypothetical protein